METAAAQAKKPEARGFMDKAQEHKRAIAMMAILVFTSIEAATVKKAYAQESKTKKSVEYSLSNKEVQELEDQAGRHVFITTVKMESDIDGDGRIDPESEASLTAVEIRDEGDPKVQGDETTYKARFTRYPDNSIDLTTSSEGHGENPDFVTGGFTPEMRQSNNPAIARTKLRNLGHAILIKVRVLIGLRAGGKTSTPEFQRCQQSMERDVQQAQKQFGQGAIDAEKLQAELGK